MFDCEGEDYKLINMDVNSEVCSCCSIFLFKLSVKMQTEILDYGTTVTANWKDASQPCGEINSLNESLFTWFIGVKGTLFKYI